jgi:pimeloyl-ACP methyl ester carboxylesterase
VRWLYQVWGAGDVDMVLMTNWRTSVDNSWEHPGRVRLLALQGSFARVVRFDPRGFGASDPLPLAEVGDLSLWVDDTLRVLDALGLDRVAVTAEAYAGQAAMLLAARYPERVDRIALLNPYARLGRGDDYPIGHSDEVLSLVVEQVTADWGVGKVTASLVPTLAAGAADAGFLGRTERSSASRAVASAMIRADIASDARALLPEVDVPVLVLHTGDHALVSVEMSRYVADCLPQARFVQATSRTFYWGDPSFDAYAEFISSGRQRRAERQLLRPSERAICTTSASSRDPTPRRRYSAATMTRHFRTSGSSSCSGSIWRFT